MAEPVSFGIVAGEKSGDILGAGLMEALRKHYPDARFLGVGGPQMIELGCESLTPMERLSVMGFVEPLGRLPELFALKARLAKTFAANPPLAFVGIDSPDFNLRLEADLHGHGIKTVHYVSPSVWAYRSGRIHKIKKIVDLMLTLFPFETGIYQEHGVPVRCVGHPLADQIGFDDQRETARQQLGIPQDEPVLALLPGSRSGEIKRLAPVFFGAAMQALQHYPKLRCIIPASSEQNRILIQDLLQSEGLISDELFQVVDDSRVAMAAANLVLLASGTATMEAMLLRRPMIVCYKLAALTYMIARPMVKIPNVALPNLLAGRQLVPEYLQNDVTVENLGQEICQQLSPEQDHAELLAEFDTIHRSLRLDASKQAAAAIQEFLGPAEE